MLTVSAVGGLEVFQTHQLGGESAVFTWDPIEVAGPEAVAAEGGSGAAAPIPISELPALNSNPGAPVDLYLDLNGHFEPVWGAYSNATTPVYDIDGDDTTFNDTELSRIQTAWEMVSEDFAPFNVNVTTVEPSVLAQGEPIGNANGVALRVAIGGSWEDWYGSSAGGVGYINNFTSSIANVVYVFSDDTSVLFGETSSHEAGHGFGLYHQSLYDANGVKTSEYNPGTSSWQPTMGGGTTSLSITSTWYDGTNSQGSTVYQDDMAVLARPGNNFGYRADDHADANGSASPLTYDGSRWNGTGIIETNDDVDVFRFSPSVSGNHALLVHPFEVAPNLDAVLELRDSGNNLMASADPTDEKGAQLIVDLAAGQDYYLHVTKTSTYGFVGQYSVTVLEVAAGPYIVASTGEGFIESPLESLRISFGESVDVSTFGVDDVQLTGPTGDVTITGIAPVAGSADTQFDIQFATQTTPGIYDLTIAPDVADSNGNPMNQDQDDVAGEPDEDGYASRFSITAPGSSFLVSSSEGSVYVNDVEVDANGYVYLAGVVSSAGTADFDPGPGVTTLTSAAYSDGFVAKYSPGQDLVWVRQMSSDGNLFAYDLQLDSSDNAYVTGYFSLSAEPATATFGAFTRVSQGKGDAFLTKLDADGNFQWAQSWGGTETDNAYNLNLTSDNAVHVGGYFRDTVDFDPSAGTHTLTSTDTSADGYVAHFDSNGNFVTATPFYGPGSDYVRRMDSDGQGNLYAVGYFAETIQFGPAHSLQSADSSDSYVVKLNSAHEVEWARQASGPSSITQPQVAVDGGGNVYLAAYFPETVNFGAGTPTFTNAGGRDSFVAKWDSAGDFQWARQLDGGEETLRPYTVDTDPENNVFISGYFGGTVDFDPGTGVTNRTSTQTQNDYLLSLDANGDFRFVHQVEREGSGAPRAMRVGPQGNVYLAWDFVGSVVLPSGDQFTNGEASRDFYVLKLDMTTVADFPPGDFNSDGHVDGDDFLAWQAGFGTQSGASLEDGDADGDVDGDDFLIWQQNFGSGSGSAAALLEQVRGKRERAVDRVFDEFARRSKITRETTADVGESLDEIVPDKLRAERHRMRTSLGSR